MPRIFHILFFLAMFSPAAFAADNTSVQYSLKNLEALRVSLYKNVGNGLDREYFSFRNASGTHHIIYDDNTVRPALAVLEPMREAVTALKKTCQLDLQCRTNAFCTGNCQNFYYETSNAPDPSRPSLNHCEVRAFSCQANAAGGAK